MASRNFFSNKPSGNNEDSFRSQNNDRFQRGYNRRNINYARQDFNSRNSSFHSNHQSNASFYYFNRNLSLNTHRANQTSNDEALSWRKVKNNKSVITQRETLVTTISNGQCECIICYLPLELDVAVWSCENCYHIFHIDCIRQWSKTCREGNDNVNWPCPTCKKEYSLFDQQLSYQCYCGKMTNPPYSRSLTPHSCGDVCAKRNRVSGRCPHLCSLLCHPGPCPVCEASVKSHCHCGKVDFIVKCTASDSNLSCGSKCEKILNCSVHTCQDICHVSGCEPCQEVVKKECCCGQSSKDVLCGSTESYEAFFLCGNVCKRVKDCGHHICESLCHTGQCESCTRLPINTIFCGCGKTPLTEILASERETCLDSVPVCGKVCDKSFMFCGHKCPSLCHDGPCPPCTLTSDVKCRCSKTSQNLRCEEIARILEQGESVRCTTRCRGKKLCGVHRCQDLCCDLQVHVCTQICGKLLSCKKHNCERPCHKGTCARCDNVSFDELYCDCGRTNMLPPIPCGEQPPYCEYLCTRDHLCDHEVTHRCHSDAECTPCTVLTSKMCPGGHKTLYNIPCFRPVVTCGLLCNQPLNSCAHLCGRICHEGPCIDQLFTCTQPCGKARTGCGHPCIRLCHQDHCEVDSRPCQSSVMLHCSCNTKTISVTCEKVEKLSILLKSQDAAVNKRDLSDYFICDNTISIACDSDCKKAARTKQLSDAFETDLFKFDRVAYSSFLRDFSVKNIDFLQQIDSSFCELIKSLDLEKLKKKKLPFSSMNRDKRRFIQELSEYFLLTSTILESASKFTVVVEAVKGTSKIPSNRLVHFIQKNYPELFRTDKPTSLRNVKIPPGSVSDNTYSGRMRSINDMNKS